MNEATKIKWEVYIAWLKSTGLELPLNKPKRVSSPLGNILLTNKAEQVLVEWEDGSRMMIPKGKHVRG